MSDEFWFRYEDIQYAPPLDEFDNPMGSGRLEVVLRRLKVVHHTSKGVWLSWFGYNKDRFVLIGARKQWACPTIKEARISFIARKTRQARIYQARLRRAEAAISLVNNGVIG